MGQCRTLGSDGPCAVYFDSVKTMVSACRSILDDASLRARLRAQAVRRMWSGGRSYVDRLSKMLNG